MNRFARLCLPLALSACASAPGNSPSLLPRAAEAQSFAEPATPPPAVATPDPALDQKIAALVADRIDAVAGFAEADRKVAGALAAGTKAPVGTDAWLDAQTALGTLDALRATILDVQTKLDDLAVARAEAGEPPYPALETAKAETDAEVTRISAIVAQRKAALPL